MCVYVNKMIPTIINLLKRLNSTNTNKKEKQFLSEISRAMKNNKEIKSNAIILSASTYQ